MADLTEPSVRNVPGLGACLALYPRLTRRARRRLAALLVVASLAAPPMAGHARGVLAGEAGGGNFRAPIAVHAPPAAPGTSDAVAAAAANPAVARALRALGLDGPTFPTAADAVPIGGEIQINSLFQISNTQRAPSVAMNPGGNFVVVWESTGSGGTDSSGYSIQGRRFNAAGVAQGDQFQVNTFTTSDQRHPVVALNWDGDFVVLWDSQGSVGPDNSGFSIQGQRFWRDGSPLLGQFQVNDFTQGSQSEPSMAMDEIGFFDVVWTSDGSSATDTSGTSVRMRRYHVSGDPLDPWDIEVNTFTTGNQSEPSVARSEDGDTVVVWQSQGSNDAGQTAYNIEGQLVGGFGLVGSEFKVNSHTGYARYPSVAIDADGDFVVVWEKSFSSAGSDTSYYGVQGQRFNTTGAAEGSEFEVNTYTTGRQFHPAVDMDADGDFVVVWQSYGSAGSDSSGYSIQGQAYRANGDRRDGEFQVNTVTTFGQRLPAMAMDNDGDFVAVWEQSNYDTRPESIQGQRFLPPGAATPTPTDTPTPMPTSTDTPTAPPPPTDTPTPTPTATDSPTPTLTPLVPPTSTPTPTNTGAPATPPTGTRTPAPTSTPTPPPDPSSTVDLRYFRAIGLKDRTILIWETTRETGTRGFQVLRSAEVGDPWVPVNADLIPAAGGATAGHTYVLYDAPGPGSWRYRLEDVGESGSRGVHAPLEVVVGPEATGRAVFLPRADLRWPGGP